jgi:hypothetical protein
VGDLVERLRNCAGHLINGDVEDGSVETAMLCDAADEIERLREEVQCWKDEHSTVLEDTHRYMKETDAKHAAALSQEREECAKVAEAQAEIFRSTEYAVGQPVSSISERFACAQVAAAIRARGQE